MKLPLHTDRGTMDYELQPSKIVCVGINYRAHALEMNHRLPQEPVLFMKPSSALIGPQDTIVLPRRSARVDYEGELAVVMGRRVRGVPADEALDFVRGYTCLNDVTARDLQRTDGQWTRAKGFDTFCPVGPCIRADLDPADLAISTRVNGEVRQSSRTSDLIFSVAHLVAFISEIMTLEPGDLISTGTPAGVGPLQVGDQVEVEIESLGILRNSVGLRQPG